MTRTPAQTKTAQTMLVILILFYFYERSKRYKAENNE